MRTWPRITLFAAACLLAAGGGIAHAQATAALECPAGEVVGWIGLEQLQCNCTVSVEREEDEPHAQWSFRSEPVVRSIASGSPAANVLRRGDVIVAVDGHLITTAEGGRRFSFPTPGERLAVRIRRDGREMVLRLTPIALCRTDPRLGAQAPRATSRGFSARARAVPRRPESPPEPPQPVAAAALLPGGRLGFGFSCSSCGWTRREGGERRLYFEGPLQVYSVEPGSPADRAGLRRGDVITHVDGLALASEAGARRFGSTEPDETVRYTVRRGASTDIVTLRAAERDGPGEGMSSRELRERLERIARLRDMEEARREIAELARELDAEANVRIVSEDASADVNRLRYSGQIGDAEVEVRGAAPVIATVLEANRDLRIVTSQATIRIRIPRDGGR